MRPNNIPLLKPNLPFPPYPYPLLTPQTDPQQLTSKIVYKIDSQNIRYFEEYKKLYYTAFCLHNQIIQFQNIHQNVKNKTNIIQKHLDQIAKFQSHQNHSKNIPLKPKRFRRTNEMIDRTYRCTYQKCDKTYASQGSLQQHIRLKHQDSPQQYHCHPRYTKKEINENFSNGEDDAEESKRSSDSQEHQIREEKKENMEQHKREFFVKKQEE